VASTLAIEGLQLTDGEQFMSAETDDEFGDRICTLLAEDSLRQPCLFGLERGLRRT
jgi:hypothetical protein